MRALLIASCAFASACSPWPGPNDSSRWPRPQGLGTFITEGAPLRDTTLDVIAKNERVYVLQVLAPGYAVDLTRATERSTTLFEVDPASSAVTALPAAPIDVTALWPSDEARGFLAQGGKSLASFDGANWSTLPDLPAANPDLVYRADGERVFARAGGKVYVLSNGAWRDLATNVSRQPGAMVLGPWSAAGVRVVWIEAGTTQHQACTQTIDTATLWPSDAAVCKDALSLDAFTGDAINGTVDDFQVPFANGPRSMLVWRFAAGAWSRGSYVGAARSRATPHSKDLCVDAPKDDSKASVAALVRVSEGKAAETLFLPSFALYGCEGEERTCARNLDLVLQNVSRDCTAAWFLADNFVDATRKVYLKKVDLPAKDGVTCSTACPAGQLCAAASATEGACVIDPAIDSTSSATPASLVLQVAGANGLRPPLLSFSSPSTGAPLDGFTTQLDSSQRTLVSAPPNTPVVMTVHLAGHADRSFSFTTPNENTQADLGTLYLVRGTRLGQTPAGRVTPSLSAVVLGDGGASLVLPLRQDDGGVALTQVLDASDGGVTSRALTATDAQATAPAISPDQRWLLWSDGAGLEVLDLTTRQRTTVASTLTDPWLLPNAVFSADGTTVAIPRGSLAGAATSVIALAATPTERYGASTQGAASVQLSRDGAMLLRHLPSGWELTSVAGSYQVSGQQQAFLSGDGSRVYSASGNVGALTLWSQPATMGATATQVATGVGAVTVDPDGADALFSTLVAGKTTVSRVAGATGAVSVVQAGLEGSANALTRGALWVQALSATVVFFPFNTSVGRAFAGNHWFTFDERGQLLDAKDGLLVTAAGSLTLPRGPGVFTAESSRRVASLSLSIETLNGNTPVSSKPFAPGPPGPPVTIDARFTVLPTFGQPYAQQSYLAPCGLFSVPVKTFTVAPSGGAVTFTDAAAEVYCVK